MYFKNLNFNSKKSYKSSKISVVCLLFLLITCGRVGDSPNTPNSKQKPPGKVVKKKDTKFRSSSTPFFAQNYTLPELPFCTQSYNQKTVKNLDVLEVDGLNKEWDRISNTIIDPSSDLQGNNIVSAKFATHDNGIAIIIEFSENINSIEQFVEIELGGMQIKNKKINYSNVQKLKLENNNLYLLQGDKNSKLESDAYNLKIQSNHLEIFVKLESIQSTLHWPIWWIKFKTYTSLNINKVDNTNSSYFKSTINPDSEQFNISVCRKWLKKKSKVELSFVEDIKSIPANYKANENLKKLKNIVILAVESVNGIFKNTSWPVDSLNFIVSSHVSKVQKGLSENPSNNYRGLILNIVDIVKVPSEYYIREFPEGKLFLQVLDYLLYLRLDQQFSEAPEFLKATVSLYIRDLISRQLIGANYWLNSYKTNIATFLNELKLKNPQPLNQTIVQSINWSPFVRSKISSFSYMMHYFLPENGLRVLLDTWVKSGAGDYDSRFYSLTAFKENLYQHLQSKNKKGVADNLEKLFSAWVETGRFFSKYTPLLLNDDDDDGLPNLIEKKLLLNTKSKDSNKDGWSDYSSYVQGYLRKLGDTKPNAIVEDGFIDDWTLITPKNLNIDIGVENNCPHIADISIYSALVTKNSLIIAASTDDFVSSEPHAKWQAIVDFVGEDKQVIIEAKSNSYVYTVSLESNGSRRVMQHKKRAYKVASKHIEWSLNRKELGFENYFNRKDALKIKLRTLFNNGSETVFCDETKWFKPILYNKN